MELVIKSIFGIFNHNDSRICSSGKFWYFIEGFHYRSNEYPFGRKLYKIYCAFGRGGGFWFLS
jgi:hypothetical protein